jgi:hypothetical protein
VQPTLLDWVQQRSDANLMMLPAGVTLRTYNVIYDLVDDVRAAMEGRLDTVEERTEIGEAEVQHSRICPALQFVSAAKHRQSTVLTGRVPRCAMCTQFMDGVTHIRHCLCLFGAGAGRLRYRQPHCCRLHGQRGHAAQGVHRGREARQEGERPTTASTRAGSLHCCLRNVCSSRLPC